MAAPTVAFEEPVVTSAPRRLVLFRRLVIEHADLGRTISATFGELYGLIGRSGTFPAGPPFVVYHATSEIGVRWDVDICAPIAAPITTPPGFAYSEMPSGPVVTLTHIGSYESIGEAYAQLEQYLEENQIQKGGAPREFYLSPPGAASSETHTLIEQPIGRL